MTETQGWKDQWKKPWGDTVDRKDMFVIPHHGEKMEEFFDKFRNPDGSPKKGFNERR